MLKTFLNLHHSFTSLKMSPLRVPDRNPRPCGADVLVGEKRPSTELKKKKIKDFPDGPAAKTLHSNAQSLGSNPCWETKIPHLNVSSYAATKIQHNQVNKNILKIKCIAR